MRLLTGPAGSGKTFHALESVRDALQRRDNGVRLLVPTATMAQHLRNELAREGLIFRPETIQTISRFIETWVADVPEISHALLTLLVEASVRRLRLSEFQSVANFPGLHARLAAVIDECASAGCEARLLGDCLPSDGLGRPLAQVFEETQKQLDELGLALRSKRLSLAAAKIEQAGLGAVRTIWLDGFFSLTDPEISLLRAMTRHADVTVTLPAGDIAASTRARLLAMGFEEGKLSRQRPLPAEELVVAPGIEREVDEIARRILRQVESGRLFREVGIVVRAPEVYMRLLRATLERFGIPARFYFDLDLTEQPAIRYLTGVVDAMSGGWQFDSTLTAMKLSPGAGISAPMDRFDFEVRKRMPGAGLENLRGLAAPGESRGRLEQLFEDFGEIDRWRTLRCKPADWAARISGLRALYRPSRFRDRVNHETALEWRSQAQALDAFEKAAAEAAQLFDSAALLSLADFWLSVKTLLRLTPLRLMDQRRNVVHVLSAHEVRQWELPVVFMCGLVEGQFPRYQAPDPFLPELARRRLKERGLRIRAAEDIEREERFLFDSALHRATASVVMSYPRNDARGELNLPSLFLDARAPSESRPLRVRIPPAVAAATAAPIHSPDLLEILRQKHAEMKPTALEAYFQCPFQFFGLHTLKLEPAPERPEKRFDFLLRGTIVHRVIKEWLESPGPIEPIFNRVFAEVTEKEFVVPGYETEYLRAQMLDDLLRFAAAEQWPANHRSQAEISCRFELQDGVMIRCRIDRLLQDTAGRAFVIDYKYSSNLRDYAGNEDRLQAPLYWLAAERGFQLSVAGVYYCSLRDGVQYAGWGAKPDWLIKPKIEPFSPEWLASAVERSMAAARDIAQGGIAVDPSDLGKCRNCDFRDACRYAGAETAVAEECAP